MNYWLGFCAIQYLVWRGPPMVCRLGHRRLRSGEASHRGQIQPDRQHQLGKLRGGPLPCRRQGSPEARVVRTSGQIAER